MSRFLAKWSAPAPSAFLKSATNTVALTHTSLLSYPCVDLAGDYVVSAGCDFTPHHSDPVIDLEHRRHPMIKGMPVASAVGPDGAYAVKMVPLDFADAGQPPSVHTVPVGTEYYDKSCRVSMQVFAMRAEGALPASSLEFEMVPGFYKSIGWSALENRDAYQFDRVKVHRWTVCAVGVNPGALLIEKSAGAGERGQVPTPLGKILSDRRVNVGGTYEPLHAMIFKALAPDAASAPAKRTTVRVEYKGMNDTDPALATPADALVDDQPADAGGETGPAYNGVTALLNHAAALEDLCQQLESDLESTDSPELLKEGAKLCEMGRVYAEKVKAAGDKHDAKLEAARGRGDEPAEPAEGEEPDDSADMEKDDEGTYKAVRTPYKPILKALRVKRFKSAEIAAATAPAAEVASAPETPKQYLERIRRDDPAAYADIMRAA